MGVHWVSRHGKTPVARIAPQLEINWLAQQVARVYVAPKERIARARRDLSHRRLSSSGAKGADESGNRTSQK